MPPINLNGLIFMSPPSAGFPRQWSASIVISYNIVSFRDSFEKNFVQKGLNALRRFVLRLIFLELTIILTPLSAVSSSMFWAVTNFNHSAPCPMQGSYNAWHLGSLHRTFCCSRLVQLCRFQYRRFRGCKLNWCYDYMQHRVRLSRKSHIIVQDNP